MINNILVPKSKEVSTSKADGVCSEIFKRLIVSIFCNVIKLVLMINVLNGYVFSVICKLVSIQLQEFLFLFHFVNPYVVWIHLEKYIASFKWVIIFKNYFTAATLIGCIIYLLSKLRSSLWDFFSTMVLIDQDLSWRPLEYQI